MKRILFYRFLEVSHVLINPKTFGPLRKHFYFDLEYYRGKSERFEKWVNDTFNNLHLPGSKLVFYYRKGKNLSNIFSKNFKYFGPDNGIPGVYKISCNNCEKCYVGETGRP